MVIIQSPGAQRLFDHHVLQRINCVVHAVKVNSISEVLIDKKCLTYSPLVLGPICSRKLLFVQQKILLTCFIFYPGFQKKFSELINKGRDRYSRNSCSNGKFRFNDTTVHPIFVSHIHTHTQTHTHKHKHTHTHTHTLRSSTQN